VSSEQIDVSVIVPAYRAGETLASSIQTLQGQRFPGRFEIIVVASADCERELPWLPGHPSLRHETCVPRLAAATARNLGAKLARGASLAFTDADALAATDWLTRLSACSQGRWCVAGAVANGTPTSIAGTVEYLVEFFDLTPARAEPAEHGATCNLLLPRTLWESYGPFPEDMDGCEDTWLTTRLLADGLLRFAPDAVVHHINRRKLRAVLPHQYRLGASHARLAAKRGDTPRFPILHSAAATVGRIRYLYRMLDRWSCADRGRARRLAPLVVAGFLAWGGGLTTESVRIKKGGGVPAGTSRA
jgi:glycosyltransferase involved in cell wall biosynthesis